MREGIKLVRTLKQTPPFNNGLGPEVSPGPAVATDEQIEEWLINQAGTQYHPIASCAMLPKSQGGVVNAKLQVYGLGTYFFVMVKAVFCSRSCFAANVRVVDSSIYPFEFASHVSVFHEF
jgi:choline dehydrogenase